MQIIIVIEPAAVVRELAVSALRGLGYNALGAATGQAAIQMIEAHPPDLVLMERHLPDGDGLEVLEALRRLKAIAETPFIMWAEQLSKPDVIRAAKLNVRDFLLKKHFSFEDLLQRIQKKLGANEASPLEHQQKTDPISQDAPPPPPNGPPPAAAPSAGKDSTDESKSAPEPDASEESFIIPEYDPDASPDQVLQQLKPWVHRSGINEQLDDCDELEALPSTAAQVLKLTGDEHCSIDEVARTIRRDQGIAIRVLKLANSSVYNRGESVESLPKAVMRIGLSQIRQTVLNLHVIDSFSNTKTNRELDSRLFWEHSIACGLIASELVQARGGTHEEVDTAFTIGLLHDVGRMVYVGILGAKYARVIQAATQLRLPLERVESRLLLVNHADAMDRVLRRWRFSSHLIDPIALHHLSIADARSKANKTLPEVLTLGLANRLAHALMLGGSGNRMVESIDEFVAALELDPAVIQRIVRSIPDQVHDMKFTLLSQAPQDNWPEAAERARKQLAEPMRPIYISDRPDHDAFRIFCDQIKEENPYQPPNVAVVRLTNARQCLPLTEQLAGREAAAGTGPLPLLILSTKGNLSLEQPGMQDRPHRLLAEPLCVDRFIDTFNEVLALQSEMAVPA